MSSKEIRPEGESAESPKYIRLTPKLRRAGFKALFWQTPASEKAPAKFDGMVICDADNRSLFTIRNPSEINFSPNPPSIFPRLEVSIGEPEDMVAQLQTNTFKQLLDQSLSGITSAPIVELRIIASQTPNNEVDQLLVELAQNDNRLQPFATKIDDSDRTEFIKSFLIPGIEKSYRTSDPDASQEEINDHVNNELKKYKPLIRTSIYWVNPEFDLYREAKVRINRENLIAIDDSAMFHLESNTTPQEIDPESCTLLWNQRLPLMTFRKPSYNDPEEISSRMKNFIDGIESSDPEWRGNQILLTDINVEALSTIISKKPNLKSAFELTVAQLFPTKSKGESIAIVLAPKSYPEARILDKIFSIIYDSEQTLFSYPANSDEELTYLQIIEKVFEVDEGYWDEVFSDDQEFPNLNEYLASPENQEQDAIWNKYTPKPFTLIWKI